MTVADLIAYLSTLDQRAGLLFEVRDSGGYPDGFESVEDFKDHIKKPKDTKHYDHMQTNVYLCCFDGIISSKSLSNHSTRRL